MTIPIPIATIAAIAAISGACGAFFYWAMNFYWQNFRPGNIDVSIDGPIDIGQTLDSHDVVRFNITIFNNGTKGFVIKKMDMKVRHDDARTLRNFEWAHFCTSVIAPRKGAPLATRIDVTSGCIPYVVDPRKSESRIVKFNAKSDLSAFIAHGQYRFILVIQFGNYKKIRTRKIEITAALDQIMIDRIRNVEPNEKGRAIIIQIGSYTSN